MMETILSKVTSIKEASEKAIEKFAAEVVANPVHALSWADPTFRSVADLRAACTVLAFLEGGTRSEENAIEFVKDQALQLGATTNNSSGQCSNLLADAIATSWAKLYQDLKYYV